MKSIITVLALTTLLVGGWANAETAAERDEAREAFRAGDAAFQASHFEEALAAFERGYQLSQRPRFLLNVAHTQRKLGQDREALATYQRFLLTDPKPEDRAIANEMVTEIEARLAQEDSAKARQALERTQPPEHTQAPQAVPQPVITAEPVVLNTTATIDEQPSKAFYQRWPFWATVGGVVVVGAVGVLLLSGGDSDGRQSGSWGDLRL